MNINLEKKLTTLSIEITTNFESIRERFEHSGNKGTNGEYVVRDFLKYYFSSLYQFGNGEVIDSKGNQSGQIDIIITNKYHPFLSDYNKPSIFFIEGVSCCGEVKFQLTSTELTNALNNCRKFKTLEPIIDATITCNATDIEELERFVDKRPYFIFCYESQLTLETVHKKVLEYNSQNGLTLKEQIDGIFLMDRGCIINMGNGKGSFRQAAANGNFLSGIVANNDDKVLPGFMRWMNWVVKQFETRVPVLHHYLY